MLLLDVLHILQIDQVEVERTKMRAKT